MIILNSFIDSLRKLIRLFDTVSTSSFISTVASTLRLPHFKINQLL
jgi:hypothetical protein